MRFSSLSLRSLFHIMTDYQQVIQNVTVWFVSLFRPRNDLAAEIIALRSQLALYQLDQEKENISKPRCTQAFRITWILLMKMFDGRQDALCVVKPETVVRWHKQGFKLLWRHKSRRKNGRPVVSAEMQRFIRKINFKISLWSPERIYDQLIDMGFDPPSPNT